MPERLFAIDLRALAALRIALGTLLLVDIGLRSRELRAHYTDAGLMPREILNPWATETLVPLHLLSGDAWYQALLFAATACMAILLALGFQTRLATVASWALNLSLWVRNPAICGFEDTLLRLLLFWSMFLPLGARWSLDARRGTAPTTGSHVLSMASAALLLQAAFVYFFTGMQKAGPDWRTDFTAVYYALSQDWWVRPLGAELAQHSWLVQSLTVSTILFEIVGPLLLFLPIATARVRVAIVGFFFLLQLGFCFSMALRLFPFISSTMMLPFLPAACWEWLERRLRRGREAASDASAAPQTPPPPAPWRRPATAGIALLLLYALAYNVADAYRELPFPKSLARAGHWIGLNQHWGMYSPNVPRYDGWYVIPGTLGDGSRVNLWRTGPELSWEKPAVISALHRSGRSATYELKLSRPRYDEPGYAVYREHYARWLCREWNTANQGVRRLEDLEIYFMLEPTPPPGVEPQVQRRLLLQHSCATA